MASDSAHTEDGMADERADNESDNEDKHIFDNEEEFDKGISSNSIEQADKPADGAVGNSNPSTEVGSDKCSTKSPMKLLLADLGNANSDQGQDNSETLRQPGRINDKINKSETPKVTCKQLSDNLVMTEQEDDEQLQETGNKNVLSDKIKHDIHKTETENDNQQARTSNKSFETSGEQNSGHHDEINSTKENDGSSEKPAEVTEQKTDITYHAQNGSQQQESSNKALKSNVNKVKEDFVEVQPPEESGNDCQREKRLTYTDNTYEGKVMQFQVSTEGDTGLVNAVKSEGEKQPHNIPTETPEEEKKNILNEVEPRIDAGNPDVTEDFVHVTLNEVTAVPSHDQEHNQTEDQSMRIRDMTKEVQEEMLQFIEKMQLLIGDELKEKKGDRQLEQRSSPDVNIAQNLNKIEDQLYSTFNKKNAEIRTVRQERDGMKSSIEQTRQFVKEKANLHGHDKVRKRETIHDEKSCDLLNEVKALIDLERNEILKAKDECEVKWKTETAKCQKEVNKLREKTDQLESYRKEKDAKFVAENKERKRLEKELKDRQKKYDDQLSVNTDLAKKQMGLQQLNQKLEVDLKNGQSNLSQAISRLRDRERQIREREQQIREQQKSMEELLNQNQSLYQNIDRLSSQLHSYQNQVVEFEKTITLLEEEKSKLNLRLSKLAGAHLTRDNPNIADLSDENRPTKLAEKYSELYDNEWTDAFEELGVSWGLDDRSCVDEMMRLLKVTNTECMRLSKPHREVIENLQTVTIHLDQLSTRNKLTKTLGETCSPKSSSVDQRISPNVVQDTFEGSVPTIIKDEVEDEDNTNSQSLSTHNKESPVDSTDTSDEIEVHNQEYKPYQKTAIVPEETSGKGKHCDAFKTDLGRKEIGNEEHVDSIANNQSDVTVTKRKKEPDEEESDNGKDPKVRRRETKIKVINNDTLESTGDQEGVGVVSNSFENVHTENELANQNELDRNQTAPDKRHDAGEPTGHSEGVVRLNSKVQIHKESQQSTSLESGKCSSYGKDIDHILETELGNNLKDNDNGSIKGNEESIGNKTKGNNNSLKEHKANSGVGNEEFSEPNEFESTRSKEAFKKRIYEEEYTSMENKTPQDTQSYNNKEELNRKIGNDEPSDKSINESESKVQKEKNTTIRDTTGDTENDQSSPVREEMEKVNDQQHNEHILNTKLNQIKGQYEGVDCYDENTNTPFKSRPEVQRQITEEKSVRVAGASTLERVSVTHESDTSIGDGMTADCGREINNLDQGTKSTDEKKGDRFNMTENMANDRLKKSPNQSAQEITKPSSSHDVRKENFEDTDDNPKGIVNEECQELEEDDIGKNCKIPDRFDTNVDTGHVTAEISIKVDFTAEQKKTISEMKRTCATKLEQEKTISEVIAQKVAFDVKNDYLSNETVMAYIKKCAEICWYMAIQEPPVVIGFENMNDDVLFDKDKYKAYTKTGKILDFVVWPPLYLHEGGPMLCKGTAQGKGSAQD